MNRIELFADRPRPQQIVSAIVIPAVFGAVVGLALGASAQIYWLLQVIAAIGGLLAGMEHLSSSEGAKRGVLSGFIFGLLLLTAHSLSGAEPQVDIGDPEIVLALVTAVAGALLGAIGAGVRSRHKETHV